MFEEHRLCRKELPSRTPENGGAPEREPEVTESPEQLLESIEKAGETHVQRQLKFMEAYAQAYQKPIAERPIDVMHHNEDIREMSINARLSLMIMKRDLRMLYARWEKMEGNDKNVLERKFNDLGDKLENMFSEIGYYFQAAIVVGGRNGKSLFINGPRMYDRVDQHHLHAKEQGLGKEKTLKTANEYAEAQPRMQLYRAIDSIEKRAKEEGKKPTDEQIALLTWATDAMTAQDVLSATRWLSDMQRTLQRNGIRNGYVLRRKVIDGRRYLTHQFWFDKLEITDEINEVENYRNAIEEEALKTPTAENIDEVIEYKELGKYLETQRDAGELLPERVLSHRLHRIAALLSEWPDLENQEVKDLMRDARQQYAAAMSDENVARRERDGSTLDPRTLVRTINERLRPLGLKAYMRVVASGEERNPVLVFRKNDEALSEETKRKREDMKYVSAFATLLDEWDDIRNDPAATRADRDKLIARGDELKSYFKNRCKEMGDELIPKYLLKKRLEDALNPGNEVVAFDAERIVIRKTGERRPLLAAD